jgi:hypothetical protein
MVLRRIAILSGIAVAAARLMACSSQIPQPPAAAQPQSALVEVAYPPPPARVEFVPSRPSDDSVWVNGEWLWAGRRWSWRPGMWVVAPPNAAYARRVLVRRSDGRLFCAPGTWRDKQGQEVTAPAEKIGRPASGAIVNPEGETEPTGADIHPDAGDAVSPHEIVAEAGIAPSTP